MYKEIPTQSNEFKKECINLERDNRKLYSVYKSLEKVRMRRALEIFNGI